MMSAPNKLKLIKVLFVLLIAQFAGKVTCADYSEEEIPSDIKKCFLQDSQGYCLQLHQCLNGTINYDGIHIMAARFDYDDYIEVGLDNQGDPCEFLTRCCAVNSNRDLLRFIESEGLRDQPEPTCGTNHPNGYVYRVKNSSVAQFAEFPWMASLLQRKMLLGREGLEYFCGGSLIHPKVVLTAAHCMWDRNGLNDLVVRLGEWDTVTENEPLAYQQYGVRKMIVHENFVDKKYHNDLALLILNGEAELDQHINPICLPSADDNFDYQRCMVSGWGKENFNPEGKYSEVLKKVEVPVVPRERCREMFRSTRLGPFFQLHLSFLCAGGERGVDVCKGDGGSPLACKSGDQFVQAGIVAWGLGCGENRIPGAYVDVSKFVDWIRTKLQGEGIDL